MKNHLLATSMLAISLLAQPLVSYAGFAEALAAYQKGDYQTALKEWRLLANQGNPYAQYNLGLMYANGRGVAQDYKEAAKWYRKAADQGDASAQVKVGASYANGLGVVQDYKEAVKWYRKAVEQGDADAQVQLGSMYFLGNGVVQDNKQAKDLFLKAVTQGNVDAMVGMGSVAETIGEQYAWYDIASSYGNEKAGKYRDELDKKLTVEEGVKALMFKIRLQNLLTEAGVK